MEDDKDSIASSYIDSEDDLLTSFKVLPEPGIHYQVLVIRSPHPLNVTLKSGSGFTEFKELKSHESDSNCNTVYQFHDTFQHLGTFIDASRAKAIWDTIEGKPKKMSRDTIAPDGASSPASSFDVIDDEQEDQLDQDLNRLSLVPDEKCFSIPTSQCSSYIRVKENGLLEKEKQELEKRVRDFDDKYEDEPWIGADDFSGDKEEECKFQSIATSTILPDEETIKVNCEDSHKALSQDSSERETTTVTSNFSAIETTNAESDFHMPHEANLELLIYLNIEFIVKMLEALKKKEKSPSLPMNLCMEYLNKTLTSDAFLNLTDEQLNQIFTLKRNDPLVEDQLAKSLVKWSQKFPTRANKLPKLLEKIRLSILQPEQLINLSKSKPIHQSIHCRDVIDFAKNDLLLSMSQPIAPHEYIYVLTHDRNLTWENQIHQINLTTQKSIKIASRQAILLASLRHCLFVFARRNITQRAIDVFEFEHARWYSMSNWPADLVISSMCTYNQCIYFIASIGTSHNFYKYDPSIDEFRMILPPSRLIIKENEKIIPFDKHILFIPSGIAYDIQLFKWDNYRSFPPQVKVDILTVHQNRVIFPGLSTELNFFDLKTGSLGNHSYWCTSPRAPPGKLIDLTVINGKLYLLEKCSDGVHIKRFTDGHWINLFKVDLESDPLRCAISTDDF